MQTLLNTVRSIHLTFSTTLPATTSSALMSKITKRITKDAKTSCMMGTSTTHTIFLQETHISDGNNLDVHRPLNAINHAEPLRFDPSKFFNHAMEVIH
jgi:hypothetical protein